MTPTLEASPAGPSAGDYKRAHAGKLMLMLPKEGRTTVKGDFFHFDSVGTHPSGLIVTGIFANAQRGHMMASSVRDANETESAWHNGPGSASQGTA